MQPIFKVPLVVLLFAASSVLGCQSDPPLDVAPNVDLSRFQGKWYEIARLPRTTQVDCHGTTAFYTQAADGSLALVNQCNLGSASGPLRTVSMTAKVPDTAEPAKLALDVGGYTGDYWILEVGPDYEYAVVGHPSRLYLWILSRTPTLDPDVLSGVLTRARSKLFDTSQLEYTPQPPAGERNSLNTPQGSVPRSPQYGCALSPGEYGAERGVWSVGLAAALIALGRRTRSRRASAPQF